MKEDFLVCVNDKPEGKLIVKVLKERTGPYEFTVQPYHTPEETAEQRARRELGFPIEGVEP